MILLYILLSVVLFLAVILWAKVKIILNLIDETLIVTINVLGIKYIYDSSKPKKREKEEKKSSKEKEKKDGFTLSELKDKSEKAKTRFSLYRDLSVRLLKKLSRRINIAKFTVYLNFGTGDAADTGIAYGLAWAMWGNIYAFLLKCGVPLSEENVSITIVPDFTQKKFDIEIYGIITFRPVHIISIAIYGGFYYLLNLHPNRVRK